MLKGLNSLFYNYLSNRYKDSLVLNNEDNIVSTYLLNGSSEEQAVDGSVTPQVFSYSPPAGKRFIAARVIIYMEGSTAFDSNEFGNQTALTNGWVLRLNGVDALSASTNRELVSYMFDAHGSELFGKVERTMIGRFSFNKFTEDGKGVTINEGESIATVVNDDLSGLTYLEVSVREPFVYICHIYS